MFARHRRLAAVATLIAGMLLGAAPAHAGTAPWPINGWSAVAPGDEPPRWTVQPATIKGPTGQPHFTYTGKPGQQFDDFVAVSNLGSAAMTFTVYATDAYNASDGSFALLPLIEAPKGLGNWLAMSPKSYAIPAGQLAIIPMRLIVPSNATPGDHAAGIIASVAQEQTTPDGQRVNVDRRIAARVYLRVEGALNPGFAIEAVDLQYDNPSVPFASGALTVTYRVRNTGNIRVHGDSRFRVGGPFGLQLSETDKIELPDMLPGAEITLTRQVDGVPPLGWINASVIVNPVSSEGLLPTATRSASVWSAPWASVGLLVVVVALVLVLAWWRKRRRALTASPVTV